MRETGGLKFASTVTPVLQENRLTKCASHPHASHLAYVINNARKSQRFLIATLLDLRNVFGEEHHNLIDCILEYHHVLDDIREIVKNLYCCFKASILTDGFVTEFVHMEKGDLQGDCFS